MKFKELQLIMEKVFRLRKDIDTLYLAGFKHVVQAVDESFKLGEKSNGMLRILKTINPDMKRQGYHVIATHFSYELQTKDALKADETHPLKISLEIGSRGNYYNTKKHEIVVSIPYSLIQIFDENLWDKDTILDVVRGEKTIFKEITEFKLKGTINHELSHWIRNAQTGHLDKMSKRRKDKEKAAGEDEKNAAALKVIRQGKISTVATDYELDAYIHNTMEYKKSLGLKKYNTKTLADLFVDVPSFRSIKMKFIKYKRQNMADHNIVSSIKLDWQKKWIDWQKKLIKRLDREKLLGKNMRKINKNLL